MSSACVYCRKTSYAASDTVHIVAESLGNVEHMLQPGIVCKGCNNYFGLKVEKPFIESPFVRAHRFFMSVPSKGSGRVPPLTGLIATAEGRMAVEVGNDFGRVWVAPPRENEEPLFSRIIEGGATGHLSIPAGSEPPHGMCTSRFVAKIGVEALMSRVYGDEEHFAYWFEALEALAAHARYGSPRSWSVFVRQAYPADTTFVGSSSQCDILHEFDFAVDGTGGMFFFLRVFGVEFALDVGWSEPERIGDFLANYPLSSPMSIDPIESLGISPCVAPDSWTLWR